MSVYYNTNTQALTLYLNVELTLPCSIYNGSVWEITLF